MDKASFEDRLTLWKIHYARQAFHLALEAGNHIIKHELMYGDPLFYSLLVSIAVNYARPFKRSNVIGCLPNNIVPQQYAPLHTELIVLRDKLFAHTDADGLQDEWGQLNQVRYRITRSGTVSYVFELPTERSTIKLITDLCKLLVDKTDYHLRKIERKYRSKFPRKEGEFILNLDPDIDEFFLPVTPVPGHIDMMKLRGN